MKLVGPWIHYLERIPIEGGIATFLSDILVLSVKSLLNKVKTDEGILAGATGDLATLTASGGKDMYIARATVNFVNQFSATTATAIANLKINGIIVETCRFTAERTGAGVGIKSQTYPFTNIGHKVTTGQIIKLDVTSNSSSTVLGFIECYEEDTGVSPLEDFE